MSSLRFLITFLSAARLVTSQAGLSALPACGQNCVTSLMGGTTLNCPADDLLCLCPNQNFAFGIRDCVNGACGAAIVPTFTSYASSICATVTTTSSSATATTKTTGAPATTTTASTSSTSTESVSKTSTSETVSSTSSASSASTTRTASAVPSGAAASSTGSAAASTSSSPSDSSTSSSGLSTAAKIGIGVGCGAGAAALLGILIFALCRRRRNSSAVAASSGGYAKGGLKISQPMPGAGRVYASADGQGAVYASPKAGSGTTDLEMTSRRYEDMVPRHQPRTMV